MSTTALIVDDEAPARAELRALLAEHPHIEVVGEAAHAVEALQLIHRLRPQLVFVDIQMPRISGLELARMLDPQQLPALVFVTAFDQHALEAFEAQALDYLLKPVAPQRLARTLARLAQQPATPQATGQALEALSTLAPLRTLPCHGHQRIVLLPLAEVDHVHARLSGVYLVAQDGAEHFTELTLKTLELRTPLLRCHRQHLVHPERIREIRLLEGGAAELRTAAGHLVPVSRRYLKAVRQALGLE
ncbi:two-component system response regulator BtsR [Roseateles sp. BYS180W]|uniref:Two-component system response regulator BtsR n=1 Tax=Roseateles rivi TaxID=3299028 RepID=A0ABW7FTH8_9BURK